MNTKTLMVPVTLSSSDWLGVAMLLTCIAADADKDGGKEELVRIVTAIVDSNLLAMSTPAGAA